MRCRGTALADVSVFISFAGLASRNTAVRQPALQSTGSNLRQVAVLKAAFAFFHGEPPCCQLRPRRRCRRAVEVVAEAEGASLGEVFGAEIAAVANELTVEDVVAIAHVYATGVEPQPALQRAGGGPQQVVVDVHVAGALIEIDQSQGADPHTEDVVTIVQHVIGDLRALAIQCSAAGEIAGEQSGVLGLEHAVVEVVVGKQGGGVVHRPPRARCLARAVPVEVEKCRPALRIVLKVISCPPTRKFS